MAGQGGLLLVLMVLTAAFLLQGIAVWMMASRLKTAVTRGQKALDNLERRTGQLMAQASAFVEVLRPIGEVARSVGDNVGQIVGTAKRRADQIDVFLEEVTGTIRSQADKLDYAVTDTVQKFEATTAAIQRDVLLPIMEISSVIKGLRTGFDYLFSKRRERDAAPVPQDEEMFI